jgi:uroporphyrinogen decarboxylase
MPEYRRLRESYSMLELCKTPALAAEITLQPIEALDVDAAIIFADQLLPLEPMGLNLEFVKGDGPVIHNPIRNRNDILKLNALNAADLGYVGQAISMVKKELHGKKPIIGFVGAPFTLASYMIEGGGSRHYIRTKSLMYNDPDSWNALMDRIVRTVTPFAASQAAGGADVIQIFDSWVGALAPLDYERYVLPHVTMLVRQIQTIGVPVIYFGAGASSYIHLLERAGADVLGLDWRIELDDAWAAVGHRPAVQGNLDPLALLAPIPEIRKRVEDILRRAGGRPGHIFNLGHGIVPETPVDHVKAVVQMVREICVAQNV